MAANSGYMGRSKHIEERLTPMVWKVKARSISCHTSPRRIGALNATCATPGTGQDSKDGENDVLVPGYGGEDTGVRRRLHHLPNLGKKQPKATVDTNFRNKTDGTIINGCASVRRHRISACTGPFLTISMGEKA